ncbi:hypothetical protein M408DRAFT_333360 [Serendipita vermifera MAFF 305830]|uniref:Uncharacterized protein n=1 Tax=Serendipita vermifera MAFF 305830 TaxID=933852 RepID=A0A0C3AAI4_SERVB|nr:hypothetical protein M408DRAFT_333360 [Serendipita vermifera MAFF 305830]
MSLRSTKSDQESSLRRKMQKCATVQQFERLQRAMLQDFDYHLSLPWQESREWLRQHWTWTNALDESLRAGFILDALKSAINAGDVARLE